MADAGLPRRQLGHTGLEVTTLGYGAMSLDARFGPVISQEPATRVLNAVLDGGVNLIDTSPDYGPSEEMIGVAIAGRRDEYVLASKVGCPVASDAVESGGRHVYTRENIVAAVEQSLRRMRTDHLDIVQFHGSPSPATLEEYGAVEVLRDLQRAGKVRFIGMSGTIPNLEGYIDGGAFDEFQIPYSALQREHESLISAAAKSGAGTVIRGGVARGAPAEDKAWDIRRLPEVAEERPRALWEAAALDVLLDGLTRMEFMLRFTLSHPDVHTTIVGTANLEHLGANLEVARKGALPPDLYAEAKRRLDAAMA
ncbi:MAG: aldo/keto reductase [Dehalococcoidia bacterium]|nr:aldo/keto reductase [Dehalococcoidia bacterium]